MYDIGLDVHENPWILPEFAAADRARPLTHYPYDPIVIE